MPSNLPFSCPPSLHPPSLPPLLQLASLADAVPVEAIETQQVAAYMGGWTVHKEMLVAGMRDIKVRPLTNPNPDPTPHQVGQG